MVQPGAAPGDLDSGSVLARIESTVEELVVELAEGRVPELQVSGDANDVGRGRTLRGQASRQARSLVTSQGSGALAYARVLVVLDAMHDLQRQGRQATQRDLYYRLLKPPLFCSVRDVNSAIQDAVSLVGVPRGRLGVVCSGRGAVAGRLLLREGPTSPWLDCSTAGSAGRSLPGDLAAIERFGLQCPIARAAGGTGGAGGGYLLVVEKDAIFQRLAEDRVWEHLPCIMVTAKGVPDLASRAFLHRLGRDFPSLLPVGLVDYNPAGVVILMTYKYGSDRMGPEGRAYTLPHLRWLGLRRCHLDASPRPPHAAQSTQPPSQLRGGPSVPHYHTQPLQDPHHTPALAPAPQPRLMPLTARDRSLIPGLRQRLSALGEGGWEAEVAGMEAWGRKADLEAVYGSTGAGHGALRDLVVRGVLAREML